MPEAVSPAPAPAEPIAPPAAPVAAEPSAIQKAVTSRDFTAYQEAKKSAKTHDYVIPDTPEPPAAPIVAAEDEEPPPVVAGQPPRPLSKRQLDANERVRKAVELATADKDAEIARLRASAVAPVRPPPAPAKADTEPDPADLTTYPEGQYDRKFIKDQARWEAKQEIRSANEQAQKDWQAQQRQTARQTREQTYSDRMGTVLKAEPAFFDTISPEVQALQTFDQLHAENPQATGGPLNALAEELVESSIPHTLMRHFSDHPEDLARLAALPPRALAREFGKLEAKLEAPAPPVTSTTKTLTSMPTPPPTVGSKTVDPDDPLDAALKRKDFPAYQAAKRARERAAASAR